MYINQSKNKNERPEIVYTMFWFINLFSAELDEAQRFAETLNALARNFSVSIAAIPRWFIDPDFDSFC